MERDRREGDRVGRGDVEGKEGLEGRVGRQGMDQSRNKGEENGEISPHGHF